MGLALHREPLGVDTGHLVRQAAILHDRVLQTMEALARGPWIADREFRMWVAEETAWLRALVEGGADTNENLIGRIAEIGGTVLIDASPGAGTYIEITVPLAAGTDRGAEHGV
ncbi:MAG: hypothetical protein ACJ72W_24005 [Actinoallomurus sp.]